MARRNAGAVPDITWAYWNLVTETMNRFPGLYGLDERRARYHNELCEHYKISAEQSRQITDNMDKYTDAICFHNALCDQGGE